MEFLPTALPGVVLIRPRVFADARGFFMETWNQKQFADAGITARFVQDNHSHSHRGVLRGMHYQLPQAQGKLVRVVAGTVYDVVADLRRSSPAFGHWEGFRLDAERHEMLWIPEGFAHGFLVLSDQADFIYKVTGCWAPASGRTLAWNDPELAIDWPMPEAEILLNDKDRAAPRMADCPLFD